MPRYRYKCRKTRERVVEVLTEIRNKEIPGTIQLLTQSYSFPGADAPLMLEPVGRECDPHCLKYANMLKAITTVLQVLVELHELEWCHCDVRWPNVICDIKANKFVLIDFEFARHCGEGVPKIKERFIHEEIRKGGNWYPFGDTHQVALMIKRWMSIHDSDQINANIISKISKEKWTAKTLLKHVESLEVS